MPSKHEEAMADYRQRMHEKAQNKFPISERSKIYDKAEHIAGRAGVLHKAGKTKEALALLGAGQPYKPTGSK